LGAIIADRGTRNGNIIAVVPEPASLSLLAASGLAFVRHRRRVL